ncbi:hypothetical protein [Staphylococcus saprophyticus]|uniref:hypothetical protein n=1 Tax=Staphylococcus saprophyticus TaxID=29385 RepID=UPI000FF8775A|nr:hypothetical protein [Staphylococcus saprophyticus]RWZ80773.1 hypothetical protein EPJ51_05025 [Staphylococcus saprophyticus]
MAYEYEGKLLDYASGSKTYEEYKAMSQELQEVYRKAKAFDEVKEFVSEKLDKDIRHYHCFKSERDNGELAAYERIDDIIQEHMEDE